MLKFRRIIASESWIPEIDGLRFIAILAVLLFHATGEVLARGSHPLSIHSALLSRIIGNGDRGVALFFVISGFVLARPFYKQFVRAERPVKLGYYFTRRLTRLEPPYLLVLLIYLISFAVVLHQPVGYLVRHTLASAFYLHNLIYPYEPPPDFVTWSLEVEVQFYLLAPLLGRVYRLRTRSSRRLVLATLTLLGCFASTFVIKQPITLLTYAGFFPAGFLLADLFEDPPQFLRRSVLWDCVGLAGWLAIFCTPESLTLRCYLPLIILPLYLTVFYGPVQRWIFRRPLLTTIGGMCYSIYLLHMLVISAAFRLTRHAVLASESATVLLQIPLTLAPVLLFCPLFYLLVERPCMNKRWPQELLTWFRGLRSPSRNAPAA